MTDMVTCYNDVGGFMHFHCPSMYNITFPTVTLKHVRILNTTYCNPNTMIMNSLLLTHLSMSPNKTLYNNNNNN